MFPQFEAHQPEAWKSGSRFSLGLVSFYLLQRPL